MASTIRTSRPSRGRCSRSGSLESRTGVTAPVSPTSPPRVEFRGLARRSRRRCPGLSRRPPEGRSDVQHAPVASSGALRLRHLDPVAATSVRRALRDPRRLRTEVLAGLVVALALIPEAISFSIIAGVDPRVGLFASFTMAVTIAVVGGRPRDLGRHGCDRPGRGASHAPVRHGLPDRHGPARRRPADRAQCARCGSADAVHSAQRDGRVRQLAGHLDLHFSGPAPDRRSVACLSDGGRRDPHHGVPAAPDKGRAGAAGRDRRPHAHRGADEESQRADVGDEGGLPGACPHAFFPDVPFTWRPCGSSPRTHWPWPLSGCWSRCSPTNCSTTSPTLAPQQDTRGLGARALPTSSRFLRRTAGCAMKIAQTMINVQASVNTHLHLHLLCPAPVLLVLVVGLGPHRRTDPDGRPGAGHGDGLGGHHGLALHRPVHPAPDAA